MISNEMFGRIKVIGYQDKLLKGNITIRRDGYAQYNGRINIPIFEKQNQLNGSLTIKQTNTKSFKGSVKVSPKNYLYGKVDIIDTPTRKFYGELIKDSHTLNSYPDNNFGLNKTLELNQDSTAFLGFNFNNNKDTFYVANQEKEAYLEVFIRLAVQRPTKLTVYTTSNNWSEQFITNNNKPAINNHISVDIPINYFGWIKIPLGDLLQNINKTQSSFQQSLAMTIEGDINSTYSKEDSILLSPKLYYEYYAVPPNVRQRLLKGSITVEQNNTKSLKGNVYVDSNWVNDGFKGSITIPSWEVTKSFKGSLTIKKQPLPRFFTGSIDIPVFNNTKLFNGSLTVKKEVIQTINGSITIPVYEQQRTIPGSIVVEKGGYANLKGNIKIPIFEKQVLLKGSITVRKDDEQSFNGNIEIPIFNNQNLFNGNVTVKQAGQGIFSGKLLVPLMVNDKLLNGSITVIKEEQKLFKGFINVPTFYIEDTLKGSITVMKDDEKLLKGLIIVPITDKVDSLKGSVIVNSTEDVKLLKGSIEVSIFNKTSVLKGNITIPLHSEDKLLKGNIYVENGDFKNKAKQYSFIM